MFLFLFHVENQKIFASVVLQIFIFINGEGY